MMTQNTELSARQVTQASFPTLRIKMRRQAGGLKSASAIFRLTAHRSLQARLSVLDFAELFNFALVHILL